MDDVLVVHQFTVREARSPTSRCEQTPCLVHRGPSSVPVLQWWKGRGRGRGSLGSFPEGRILFLRLLPPDTIASLGLGFNALICGGHTF